MTGTGNDARRLAPGIPWIDAELGDSTKGNLCWVCFAGPAYRVAGLPTFTACEHCLAYDRQQARLLGFRMLLPLMDWHTQPVEPSRRPPTEPIFRRWLGEMWSQVSVLRQWRVDGVRAAFTLLDIEPDRAISLGEWSGLMRWGPRRSEACWEAFVAGHHGCLHDVLQRVHGVNGFNS
jgi:hypothetical protein